MSIDFDRVLLQLADTLNTQFKYRAERAADIHTETFEPLTKKLCKV